MKKTKSEKPTNHSMVKEKNANFNTNEGNCVNRDWDSVADRLKTYAMKPNSYSIYRFYLNEDIPKKTFYANVATNPKLKEAVDWAHEYFGTNREQRSDERGFTDSHVIAKPLWMFLPEIYHVDLKERAALKVIVEQAKVPAVVNYHMKPIPEEDK